MSKRRVVITGMGVVSCLGVGVSKTWQRVLLNHSGIKKLDGDEFSSLPCRVGGLVPEDELNSATQLLLKPRESKTMSRATLFAVIAADEALKQSAWNPTEKLQQDHTGVSISSCLGSPDDFLKCNEVFSSRGYRRLDPFALLRLLPNMSSGQVVQRFGLGGPNRSVNTACASGLDAIGDGFRTIQHGDAEVMLAGGTEAVVSPLILAIFAQARALSTHFNDSPEHASRPFDVDRDGFVMSEGAGVLVLEERQHALNRGAKVLAEVMGYAAAGDGYSMISSDPEGSALLRCMKFALKEADVLPHQLGYINAHATSTPVGDASESAALQTLLSGHPASISSFKGHLGHILAGAGAVETILTVQSLLQAKIPATCNLSVPLSTSLRLICSHEGTVEWATDGRRFALKNSLGMGGTHASLCLASEK